MRIAHLTTVDMSHALLLATELRADVEAGHEVFALSAPGPYLERILATGAEFLPIPLTRSWDPAQDAKALSSLICQLKRLRPDVLHTHTPKAGVLGRIGGRLAGVPVVVNTCHGLWANPTDSLFKRCLVYGSEGFASLFSDYELFQNADDARTLRPILRRGRYSVVGNGIDLTLFRRDETARATLRQELGIADDEILVGGVGRRVPEKGIAEFMQMASILADRARFVWVGPEEAQCTVAEPASPVRFLGERTDMPAVYSAFDIFALPTYREGFSRAGMEAAACGLPMVLTDIRGCRELGVDNHELLLVPPRDAHALANAVGRIIDDKRFSQQLAAAATARARRDFDQQKIAAKSMRVYDAIAEKKQLAGAPSCGFNRGLVLHVLPQDSWRGAQVFAGNIRSRLKEHPRQQHRILTLFSATPAGATPDYCMGVRSGRQRSAGLDIMAAIRLRSFVRTNRPAVIVAHGGEALKYVVLSRQRETKIVYKKIGLTTAELTRPTRIILYRWLARRVSSGIGVSTALISQMREQLGMDPTILTVIPNGRSPSTFHPGDSRGPGTPIVLFIGEFESGKRPHLFLDVIAALRMRRIDVKAAMIGNGPLMNALKDRADELGVDLLGIRDDVPELLRSASVLVVTSAPGTEGLPGVLVEAGLSGIPAVSTKCAGATDVVIHGVTGFVSPDDAQQISLFVERIVTNSTLWESLSKAARLHSQEKFPIERSTHLWAELLDRIL